MVRLSDSGVRRPNRCVPKKLTVATQVFNGSTGQLNVWCCGIAPTSAPNSPVHSWNILNFFDVANSTTPTNTATTTTTTTTMAAATTNTATTTTTTSMHK